MDSSGRAWYFTKLTPNLVQSWSIRHMRFAGKTAYQRVEIMDSDEFGGVLMLDGKIQSASLDEHIYHEALVHPAILAHPDPRRVFIAGGGEGATLREVLAHSTVEKAVMVDIDGEVVELCKKHLPDHSHGAFDDPRAELVLSDAGAYLENATEPFDVAILDLPDPLEGGPAFQLFTREFYGLVSDRLTPSGTMGVQTGPAAIGQARGMASVQATLETVFPHVRSYRAEVFSFGSSWGFAVASKAQGPMSLSTAEIDRRIAARIPNGLRSYDGLTHQGMLALPKWLRDEMARQAFVSTMSNPLTVN